MPSHGLGADHEAERGRQVAGLAAQPGQPCPRTSICGGLPMYTGHAQAQAAGMPARWLCPHCDKWQTWRVDLDDFPGRVFGGPQVKVLAHAHCNRVAGARVGNRLRGLRRQAMRQAGLQPPPPRRRRSSRRPPPQAGRW